MATETTTVAAGVVDGTREVVVDGTREAAVAAGTREAAVATGMVTATRVSAAP